MRAYIYTRADQDDFLFGEVLAKNRYALVSRNFVTFISTRASDKIRLDRSRFMTKKAFLDYEKFSRRESDVLTRNRHAFSSVISWSLRVCYIAKFERVLV